MIHIKLDALHYSRDADRIGFNQRSFSFFCFCPNCWILHSSFWSRLSKRQDYFRHSRKMLILSAIGRLPISCEREENELHEEKSNGSRMKGIGDTENDDWMISPDIKWDFRIILRFFWSIHSMVASDSWAFNRLFRSFNSYRFHSVTKTWSDSQWEFVMADAVRSVDVPAEWAARMATASINRTTKLANHARTRTNITRFTNEWFATINGQTVDAHSRQATKCFFSTIILWFCCEENTYSFVCTSRDAYFTVATK